VRTRNSLVVLLWLLLVSSPVSAWACDLSCSLQRAHSDCHNVGSVTTSKDNPAMTMSPDMDMGPDQGEGTMRSDAGMNPGPGHSMVMSPQLQMDTERFEPATAPETGTSAMHDHSKSVSSCTHETCSQVSVSASPPPTDLSRPSHQQWMAIRVLSPDNLYITFYRIRLQTPPPKMLAPDRLTTTLRI
jgi:hypothetical protein